MLFTEVSKKLRKAVVDFRLGSEEHEAVQKVVEDNVPIDDATAVSSLIVDGPFKHYHLPVLDLDVPHWYGESSTPGHGHLIIQTPLQWPQYCKLLEVLEECGIIESGYRNVALNRGQSWMRTPWTKKQKEDAKSR